MKRFSIFCAALFAAVTSFAAVTYELNGGVTNDENWLGKGDMFAAFMTDAGVSGFETLEYYMQQADPLGAPNICAKLTDASPALQMEKWAWLKAYIEAAHVAQAADGASALPADGTGAAWRYAVGAFFVSGQRASWPKSADFSSLGLPAAFIPSWQHAFANPTEVTEGEFVLNEPYKEGSTFDGWYAAADFSGEKVTVINAETTGTLYAKWVEYIPTIAEVKALADDTETKVAGVVNFISGKNVYIQDATGGILVYTAENPTFAVGEKIIAKGVKVMYGGAPEVKSAVVESAEAGELAAPVVFENLAALVADTEFKYFATRVNVPGLKIVSYDSYNNPTVADALGNQAVCYKMSLDPAEAPVGSKITVDAVAGWYNGFQFVGDVAGLSVVPGPKKDTYAYPVRHEKYTLTNNWVVSMMEDNFAANKPGGTDMVRGMAAKDGMMYFISREAEAIIPVVGATGEMLDPIKIKGEHIFQKVTGTDSITGEPTWGAGPTLAYNDIKFDQAGNCLIGACVQGSTICNPFQIYMVDLATGEATEILNDVLWDNPGLDSVVFRFDAFGVAGDVTKNGVIMAADATQGNWLVYRWLITDGVAGEGEQIAVLLDPAVDQSLYINAAGFYTAPQIFPQDELGSLFYVDGFYTLPMLFYGNPEEGATLVDDFIYVPTGKVVTNNEGDELTMNEGHNGLVEFQVGEEYFLLMTASNTAASVTSAFALYKFADENRSFAEMEPLWYFPAKGMGATTNSCRTAVPSVDVIDDNTAVLYLYTNNNGYAAYTLKTDGTVPSGLDNVELETIGARKVVENGQVYIIKNGVKYNLLGAEVK